MVAHALLPEKFVFQQRGKEMAWHLGGDGRAVVVIDVDGKFSITKVVHMILRAANELEPSRMAEAAVPSLPLDFPLPISLPFTVVPLVLPRSVTANDPLA